jgi:hypothetical protein
MIGLMSGKLRSLRGCPRPRPVLRQGFAVFRIPREVRRRLAVVLAVLGLAACGSSSDSGPSDPGSTTATVEVGTVTVTRTGGIAGLMDTVTIAADGSVVRSSRTGRSTGASLDPAQLDRLHDAVTSEAFAAAAADTSDDDAECCDLFGYTIVADVGGRTITVVTGDGPPRAPEVEAVIDVAFASG